MPDFIHSLELIDQNITLAINKMHSAFTDEIWKIFSDRLIWLPLYLLVLVFIYRKLGWKRGLIATLAIALCILCVDQFCNVVKLAVARLRPCNNPVMIQQGLHMLAGASVKHCYGFFSAHAGNAMAFAVASSLILRKAKWAVPLCAWAALVGISRIFVGKHFTGDVLVGFIVGALIAGLFVWIFHRYLRPVLPNPHAPRSESESASVSSH